MTTPRLSLTELTENQAGAHTVVNLDLRKMEAFVCSTIVDRDLTTPPGSPTDGAVYIPAATATGAWTGWEGRLALYSQGWYSQVPKAGFIIYVVDEAKKFIYNGATWDEITSGGGSTPTGTGFPHITAGVQDGAAKLVENADVHASAGIALSKLESIANLRLVGNVSGAGATPALVTLDNDATLAANSASTVPTQAAVKGYVDAVAQGLSPKKSVRVATTAAGTLATSFENGDTVDGVVLATGDRILIKDQASGAENGIYTVAASGAPTRATDMDTAAEVQAGVYVFVEEGTVNADSGWVLTTDGTITLNTTALAFTQFSGAGQITAGAAMTKTGNTLDVAVDNSTIEVSSDALRVKDLGISTAKIAADAVTYAKMQNVSATDKVLGRSTAGAGDVEEIACTAAGRAILDDADAAAQRATLGLVIGTNVQAYDAELAAIAGLTSAANKGITFTGSGTAGTYDLTAFALTLLDDANAAAARGTLGLGTIAVENFDVGIFEDSAGTLGLKNGGIATAKLADAELNALAGLTSAADKVPYFTGSGTAAVADLTTFGRSLIDDADASAARTTLGVVIGTNVQAYDAELAAIAGLTSAADKLPYFSGSGTAALADLSAFARTLLDDAADSNARTTLGLGTMAVLAATARQLSVCFHAAAGTTSASLGAHSSTQQWLTNNNRNITQVDLTNYTQCRIVARVTTGSASPNSPRVRVRYYTSFSTTVGDYIDAGTSEIAASVASTGMSTSSWIDLAAGAKADIFLIVDQIGGDGSATPAIGQLQVQFR